MLIAFNALMRNVFYMRNASEILRRSLWEVPGPLVGRSVTFNTETWQIVRKDWSNGQLVQVKLLKQGYSVC